MSQATPNAYSLRDASGSFYHPSIGTITFSGDLGVGSISFEKTVNRTVLDVAGDGGIMGSALPGDNGIIHLEIQQVSPLQGALQTWANALFTAQSQNDVSEWFDGVLTMSFLVDGSIHNCTGVAPTKEPTKVYGAQGAKLVWDLLACRIVSTTPSPLLQS
jgi:hypothetical protein